MPGFVRAFVFAGGWKGGLDYARLRVGVLCSCLFEDEKVIDSDNQLRCPQSTVIGGVFDNSY